MALPTSAAINSQSFLTPLQSGVDFTCLRGFLPKTTKGSDSGISHGSVSLEVSLRDTPVELKNFARPNGNHNLNSPTSCSLSPNISLLAQGPDSSQYSEENGDSSAYDTPKSVAAGETDNFLAESESQCRILFAFIERGINLIYHQLDNKTDSVTVSLDHHADSMSNVTYTGSDRTETPRDDLQPEMESFCDTAQTYVKELQDCLMMNLSQLFYIFDDYTRAYPKDKALVANFRASKEQSINKLNGQLAQCQDAVEEDKRYLEAKLSVDSLKDLMQPKHKTSVLFSWIHFVVFLLSVAALAWFAGYKDRYIGLFYLYRGPMFIILYLYLYSLNLVGWATANIDYIKIFDFSSRKTTPNPTVIFNMAGILSLIFTVFVALLMFTVRAENELEKSETEKSEIPERILPLLLWVITAAVLVNPFKWLMRKGRWAVVKVTGRVLLAPLFKVRFNDTWFADQLNSIVVILLDAEFMLCFYSYIWPLDKHEDGKECNRNTYIVRPVISCLPAFWRLMQCLRCYYDTRRYSHLINAGKYLTTFPVVVLSAIYSSDRDSLTTNLLAELKDDIFLSSWVVASFIHAVYTFIWDVYMDWGLFRFQSNCLLRPDLRYSWKSLYYLAIIEDLFLRFAWSLKLSLGLHLQAQVNLFYTLLAGLEIFRRFVWNFYRVEYEYIKKTTQSPVYTQLPVSDDSDDSGDDNDGDIERSLLRSNQPSINIPSSRISTSN